MLLQLFFRFIKNFGISQLQLFVFAILKQMNVEQFSSLTQAW